MRLGADSLLFRGRRDLASAGNFSNAGPLRGLRPSHQQRAPRRTSLDKPSEKKHPPK